MEFNANERSISSLSDRDVSPRRLAGVRLCDICVDELKSLKELADADALEPGLQALQVQQAPFFRKTKVLGLVV